MPDLMIIDTDILIDISHNNNKAIDYLENMHLRYQIVVSVITQMELLVRCRNKKESVAVDKFLNRFQIFGLNEPISRLAVNLLKTYRLSHGLLIPDALIAATALHLNSDFATKNQRDYRFIENLNLLPY